jgi:hypothetical protein
MIRFGILFLILLVSLTFSLPICNVSFWVNPEGTGCSAPPNGTYSGLNYNGNCTLTPDDPKEASYTLVINPSTKIVENFTVYDSLTCRKTDTILIIKNPLPLDSCAILYFQTTSTSFVEVGTLVFSCKAND